MKIRVNERVIQEMATVNLDDHFRDFNYPTYTAVVKGAPREHPINDKPHLHISNKQEGWEIRMSLDGHFISVVRPGNRSKNDRFTDIEKAYRKWLVRQNVSYPEITNYVHVQREWNQNNPDHRYPVKEEL